MAFELMTARLVIRPLEPGDLPAVVRLLGDARVMERIDDGRPVPPDVVERVWPAVLAENAALGPPLGRLAVTLRSDGEWLGWVSLRPPDSIGLEDASAGALELGFRLLPEHWGHGYASEAARAVVARAVDDPSVLSVVATTMAVNVASRRVLEKAGLTYVRTFFHDWDDPLPGAEEGDVVYALDRAALAGRGE